MQREQGTGNREQGREGEDRSTILLLCSPPRKVIPIYS